MKKHLESFFKALMVAVVMIFTTSCSLMSDISNNLIEVDVTYDNSDAQSGELQNGDIVQEPNQEEIHSYSETVYTNHQSQISEETVVATVEAVQTSIAEEQEIYADEEWIENARSKVTEHYKETSGSSGDFVCFSYEDIIEDKYVKFVLRYSMSEEEADEIIENGGLPSANIYQSLVEIEIQTGKITDEGGNVWYLNDDSSSQPIVDVQREVELLSDFIDVAARYDNCFTDPTDDNKWNVISMLAYYKGLSFVDDSTLQQWLRITFNDDTIPSLIELPSVVRKNQGYEFFYGDPPEVIVEHEKIAENSDGTISVICDVYSYSQTNTANECEYGLIYRCEIVLTPNIERSETENDYRFRIKEVKEIASFNYAGSCGENVMYAVDEDSVAYIYGNGRMNDYAFTTASGVSSGSPFSEGFLPIANIKKIIIEEGITYIGTCAFPKDCCAAEIYFPESVTEIGDKITRTLQGETDVWEAGLTISDDYTIYCYKDSYVHHYAVDHGLRYELR